MSGDAFLFEVPMGSFLASLFFLVALVFSPASHAQVRNPGFETAAEGSVDLPSDWRLVGAGTIALDTSVKQRGERSLRIERKPGSEFAGMGQFLDAKPWRGKLVRLTAWMRAENLDGRVGLWLRGDSKVAAQRTFVNSPANPTTTWSRFQAVVEIDPDAQGVAFGATLSSNGVLWVDSLELSTLEPSTAEKLSAAAGKYLADAAEILRANALNAAQVDWDAALARAQLIAAGAATPAEVHPGVAHLLQALKDGHSFLLPPQDARALSDNVDTGDFNLHSEVVRGKGLVRVPGYSGTNPIRETAFAEDLAGRIRSLASTPVCGWIVDLREDGGGNMYPMLRGLGAFLGPGDLGYFVGGKQRTPWSAGGEGDGRLEHPVATDAALIVAPVAVLTGPRTASSGEAVVVAFRHRENTRSFGAATSGQSTGNSGFTLSDGAMMLVTTVTFADRLGKVYGGPIAPDESVAGAPGMTAADDPVIRKASQWLDRQPGCPQAKPIARTRKLGGVAH